MGPAGNLTQIENIKALSIFTSALTGKISRTLK